MLLRLIQKADACLSTTVIIKFSYKSTHICNQPDLPRHLERKFVLLSENSKIWNLSKSSQWGHLCIIKNLVLNKQLFCIFDIHREVPAAKQVSNAYFSPVMSSSSGTNQVQCFALENLLVRYKYFFVLMQIKRKRMMKTVEVMVPFYTYHLFDILR